MALVQNKHSYPYAPLEGDLKYSVQNRILLEIANFLVNNGCKIVYSDTSTNVDTISHRYTLHVKGNIYIQIYFSYTSTLNIDSGFGPLNGAEYTNYKRSISIIPTSGILEMSYVSSNNCKMLLINNSLLFSCFLFNKGWVNSEYSYGNRFVFESVGSATISHSYHFCSKVDFESGFKMTDINDKHLLLKPIFTVNKIPKNSSNYQIYDELIYMGECYVYPASMGNLQENIFYQASDGTKYFNGGLLKNILIVD